MYISICNNKFKSYYNFCLLNNHFNNYTIIYKNKI